MMMTKLILFISKSINYLGGKQKETSSHRHKYYLIKNKIFQHVGNLF